MIATSCGGQDAADPVRSYTVSLQSDDSSDRYRYVAAETPDIRVGDEVRFEFTNTGRLVHDFRVVDPDGVTIGILDPVPPGESATLTVQFERPGFHALNCVVDDHLIEHGMQSFVEVTDPDT